MQSAVIEQDRDADAILEYAMSIETGEAKALIHEELRKFVLGAIKTKDNRLWKPYNALKAKMPALIAKWLPQWREPKKDRWAAASWISARSGVDETPATVLAACSVGRRSKKQHSPIAQACHRSHGGRRRKRHL
jgi:hypothetical protein